VRNALREYFRKQQFAPTFPGIFLNPFYLARRELRREIKAAAGALQSPLLDVGCGSKPYRNLFEFDSYVGMDIASQTTEALKQADVFYDGHRFPFRDGQFKAVLCNQVLEHVFTPDAFIQEIRRVLAPGGLLLLTVPFVWDEHEQPFDYARYSSFGLKELLERHRFKVRTQRKLLANAGVLFQLVAVYVFKVLESRSAWVNLAVTAFLIAPITLFGLLAVVFLPRNQDLFLDQLVIAESI
jgi:SAM-dependent methyltransferase